MCTKSRVCIYNIYRGPREKTQPLKQTPTHKWRHFTQGQREQVGRFRSQCCCLHMHLNIRIKLKTTQQKQHIFSPNSPKRNKLKRRVQWSAVILRSTNSRQRGEATVAEGSRDVSIVFRVVGRGAVTGSWDDFHMLGPLRCRWAVEAARPPAVCLLIRADKTGTRTAASHLRPPLGTHTSLSRQKPRRSDASAAR